MGACVELPFQSALAATGRGQGQVQGSVRVAHGNLTTTPRLFLQVEGWAPAYPVALDRLGVFWRTIRSQQRQVRMPLVEYYRQFVGTFTISPDFWLKSVASFDSLHLYT